MIKRNNQTLLLIIIVLLVTNGIMLYLLNRPAQPKGPELSRSERMVKMVTDELSLNQEQVNQYLTFRNHRDSMLKPLQAELRASKMDIIKLLGTDSLPPNAVATAAAKIGEKQAAIELAYFQHFQRMQAMLKDDQQEKFDTMLLRMVYRSTGAGDSVQKSTPKPGN